MYEEHFGLKRPPFRITPDTSLFYDGGKRGDILEALVYSVHRGEGIVKVVGEVGSGKTMLCRMLQLRLPKTVEIIYIANPSVSAQDILFVIAHELDLPVGKDASKHEVMHMLQDYLLQRHMENKQVVLFIEEAQGMPLDTLEEIRLLSNLETDQNKLLQIILFGQPELDDNLAQQSIRQLRERITHNFNLSPLTHDEIHNYLNFRMREVGYTGPELVDVSLARKVEQHSGGLLRRINIIADKILLSAYAEGTHNLTTKHVLAAVNDSSFGKPLRQKTRVGWWVALMIVLIVVAGIYFTQPYWMSELLGDSTILSDTGIKVPRSRDREANAPLAQPVTTVIGTEVEVPKKAEPEIVATIPVTVTQASMLENSTSQNEIISIVSAKSDAVAQNTIENEPLSEPIIATKEESIGAEVPAVEKPEPDLTGDNDQWLNVKLQKSLEWLGKANKDSVSIQVLMRRKSAASELVNYLRYEWPLDIEKTYLYEVKVETQSIYRVFYSEFDSFVKGQSELKRLPDSVKVNVPYLQSIHRMQNALL